MADDNNTILTYLSKQECTTIVYITFQTIMEQKNCIAKHLYKYLH